MNLYIWLADAVVVVHGAYVGVVVFGLLAILLGVALRWKWVRNFWFRVIHFLMILIVVVQALANVLCPLTTLENYLREKGGGEAYYGSFIGHWVHNLIIYDDDIPASAFTIWYCLFGAAVLATLVLAPPRWPWAKAKSGRRPVDA